jgi:hypothetical protein
MSIYRYFPRVGTAHLDPFNRPMLDETRSPETIMRVIFCIALCFATFGLVQWPKPVLAATADEATKSLRNLSAPQRKSLLEEGARKEGVYLDELDRLPQDRRRF